MSRKKIKTVRQKLKRAKMGQSSMMKPMVIARSQRREGGGNGNRLQIALKAEEQIIRCINVLTVISRAKNSTGSITSKKIMPTKIS